MAKEEAQEAKAKKAAEKELAEKKVGKKDEKKEETQNETAVAAGVIPKAAQKEPEAKRFRLKSIFWLKDITLGVVNLAFIVSLVVLLGKLPGQAKELKILRNASLNTAAKSSIEIAGLELEASREKAERINSLFPDDGGLIDFVNQIDALKEEGVISRFSFTSEEVIRDRTGYYGIPVFIEFTGSWGLVGEGLSSVQSLPYLLRAVGIQTEVKPEENLVIFKYGGFLYVDESLAKD